MWSIVTFGFLVTVTLTSAQYCPPLDDVRPCTCDEFGTTQIVCSGIVGEWDLKATFTRLAEVIDNSLIFDRLLIHDNDGLLEIVSNSIPGLKFRSIEIVNNENLVYISPNAFPASFRIASNFEYVAGSDHGGQGNSIFDLINNFVVAESVNIRAGIREIPEDAFSVTSPRPRLRVLKLYQNSLRAIGNWAFVGLPNLEELWLSYNDLTSDDGIGVYAFHRLGFQLGRVELHGNRALKYLHEETFRALLDSAGVTQLGIAGMESAMECGPRADWICANSETYTTKLVGYNCEGSEFNDVWEYCDSMKNSTRF